MGKYIFRWQNALFGTLVCLLLVPAQGWAFTFTKILEYTDNKFDYSFQFPSDWRSGEIVEKDDFGEIRVLLQGPRASSIMVLVDPLDQSFNRSQFLNNPNRHEIVGYMIDYTVNQIYRTSSKRMNASKMIVVEKRIRPSNVGIKFYISTLHVVNGIPLGLAGIHTIPYGKEHAISFVMSSILDSQTMENNATFKRIFNSFHLVGEEAPPPPAVIGGAIEQAASWVPMVGEVNWKDSLSTPLLQNKLVLWSTLALVILLTLVLVRRIRHRRAWDARFTRSHSVKSIDAPIASGG